MFDALDLDELEAAADDLHAAQCRADFETWCRHALPSFEPAATALSAHQKLLIAELQRVADTPDSRLLVMMPPGSAKSTYVSRLFPAWLMAREKCEIIGASHTALLAETFSRRVQWTMHEHADLLGCTPRTDAAVYWHASNRSSYFACGVGGATAGRRSSFTLIDDPVKSAKSADSEVDRETAWNWYNSDILTRLKPTGRVVIVMTRWHQDDLAGRILDHEAADWRVIRLPALAEAGDPLGRAIGEPLWDDDAYGYGSKLRGTRDRMQAEGAARSWSALYQQSPTPGEGLLFKTALIETLDACPPGRSVRAWDLAATEAGDTRDPDWTVGLRLTKTPAERWVVDDIVRDRCGPEGVEAMIKATASRDGKRVQIRLPQDGGQAGKAQVLTLTRMLAGHDVEALPVTGAKETRAKPVAAQCNVGNLSMVRAGWNRAFTEELAAFPAGSHDDQVDALADAFNALIGAPKATVQKLGY